MLTKKLLDEGKKGCEYFPESRPAYVEAEAIARAINLAEATAGRLYIFHMSTSRGTEAVWEGQNRGVDVHAETGPHYLLLDDELFKRDDGHHFATCPPIRKPEDQEGLWMGLASSVIEVLATDTCTFNSQQKAMWEGDYTKIPFGMPGIETLLPLTYSYGVGQGRISLGRMIKVLCENPAILFGMWSRKGSLDVGKDADVVVFDPDLSLTITPDALATNCDYSPFDGTEVTGWPTHTLLRGKVIVRDRKFVGEIGGGKFIAREPHQPDSGMDGEE